MNPKTNYYPYFDYLRIALAIVVMLFHDGIIRWSYSGNLAVQVFFALSGWLIGGILLKLARSDLPRFYFNRALRIWIPYYIALALLIVASLLHDPVNAKWIEFVFYKFSFVYNIFGTPQLAQHMQDMPLQGTGNHFWSVNAEEQFYLVAPIFLVLAVPKIGRSIFLWVAIALAAWITGVYASIVFGVLAAVLINRYGSLHTNRGIRYALFAITIATTAGILWGLNYDLLAPLFSVSVVLLLAVKGSQDRFGAFLGGISYPLYLNHWLGTIISNALLGTLHLRGSAIQSALSVVVSLAIAAGLYWWVDRRIVSVRGNLFSPSRGIATIVIAYGLAFIGIIGGLIFTLTMRSS